MLDYLIIGQGLAGTLLFHQLDKRGAQVKIIDQGLTGSASVTAAGLINPVTGRRYVKSWRIDELRPEAINTYKELETLLGIKLYYPSNILRSLFNRREREDWLIRSGDPEYQQYIIDNANLGPYEIHTNLAYSYGETQGAAQVDIPLLVQSFREYLKQEEAIIEESFNPSVLTVLKDSLTYKDIEARKIVFAEGFKGESNPWFSYLPFNNTKGEILLIRIPGATFKKIFKHRVFIVPLKNELYWVGSKYDWNYEDVSPSKEGKEYLIERLHEILTTPFEIVSHKAAIRPTVHDRRPFLGLHPDFPNLAIFNGLGTKGASLGPFFANEMAEFLESGVPISPEASISRFLT